MKVWKFHIERQRERETQRHWRTTEVESVDRDESERLTYRQRHWKIRERETERKRDRETDGRTVY